MLHFTKSDSRIKPILVAGLAMVMLSACGDKDKSGAATGGQSQYEVAGDHAIGNADAAVTIVEYASVVCGACANFHNTAYDDIKKKYVDSGKVRFVFREFPTSPENLARAGFLIANCADEDKFFENISLQFKRQRAILSSADYRQEYINIAKAAGLSEAEFEACMVNEDENAKYDNVVKGGMDAGVASTPTFFVNGKHVKRTASGKQLFTLESFDEYLAPLLGDDAPAAAEDAPAEDAAAEETPEH